MGAGKKWFNVEQGTPQTDVDLKKEITALQERVAFAELSRDNAIAQRDAVTARAKVKAQSAGRRITKLIALVEKTAEQQAMRDDSWKEEIAEILGEVDQAERVEAVEEMAASMSKDEVAALPIRDSRPTHPCEYCGAPYYEDGEPAFDDHPGAR